MTDWSDVTVMLESASVVWDRLRFVVDWLIGAQASSQVLGGGGLEKRTSRSQRASPWCHVGPAETIVWGNQVDIVR